MYNLFGYDFSERLTKKAMDCSRKRFNLNLHSCHSEPVQKLFNAITEESYIRPHRHLTDPKDELLIVVRGIITLVIFDDEGQVISTNILDADKSTFNNFAVEIKPNTWHTILSNSNDTIILEIKSGPFDPKTSKDFAPWAPKENGKEAYEYFKKLRAVALQIHK